ncbi:MAG: GTPase Era [Candidatus Rokubacteria bacterium 13_1_40CM_69_27]|nr:MAG: GTPase Era [Candidatus Rokubacteria bacterium 13_1_40CM_69_27]OLC39633.1 MAG: GTPase Era [Candidatus Rokubacteria bacterium 13_1_40CM_4_69_5]
MRAGFVALIGRPNAGKSTLLNRLVGEKMAIVSPRPQTTRNRITGIRNLPGAQIVFVDTPGLHPAGGKLGEFMSKTVERALEDVDLICVVVDAAERQHPDQMVLETVRAHSAPAFCLLNKADEFRAKSLLLPRIDAWRTAHAFREILPISALDGTNCDRLVDLIAEALPEHPCFFPADTTTDQPETFYVAEVIREKIFLLTREEVPYAVAVRVDELVEHEEPPRLDIQATIFVERDSQKGILIGKGGSMLKRIGMTARQELEAFFGVQVFLGLAVQLRRAWRKDDRALREFGFRLTS